jgi:ATP-binding cassette subfamily B protein
MTHPLIRLWRYGSLYRQRIATASFFSFLNQAFDLAPPLLIGAAIDIIVQQQDSFLARFGFSEVMTQLWLLAGITVLVWGLESLTEYISEVLWRNLAQRLQHDLRMDTYDHVQHLELAYFEDRSTGGLMAVLNDDVNQLERFLDVGAADIVQLITTIVLIGGLYVGLAPSVAWWAFLPMPFIIWGSLRFQHRIAPKYAAVREKVSLLNGQLANNLSGITTIKSFVAEARETERIREASDDYRSSNREAIRLSSAFVPLIRMAIVVGFTTTLVYGGYLTNQGTLSVGAFGVLVFMTQRLLWPLTRLGQTFDLYQRAMASTNRILNLLATEKRMQDGEQELYNIQGDMRLEDVFFAYPTSAEVSVLRGVSLEFTAGKTTAIVGATGAGKSTLIKLLLRFYDPTDGRITLDGRDVRDVRMADLRRSIGLVSQDVFLFHGTVRENIAYGRPDASFEDIVRAAKIAEAHDFIMNLPQGYDTIVGERGQKLSGGQRQRVSIARAVVKDPPILILDEATSAVDNETEAAIQRSLEHLAIGRTTIVIAHRLSTVRGADKIYVLEHGQLAESGAHDALISQSGIYASLWNVQTGIRPAAD